MSELHLSPRQIEVCALIAAGYSYGGVAKELGISAKTVEFHMKEAATRLRKVCPWLQGTPRRIIQGYYVEFAGVQAFHMRRQKAA